MKSPISRMTLGGALAAAFLGGLVFASGLDLTRFGYAQSSTRPASSVAPIVPPPAITDLNLAFTSIAEHVTPASRVHDDIRAIARDVVVQWLAQRDEII